MADIVLRPIFDDSEVVKGWQSVANETRKAAKEANEYDKIIDDYVRNTMSAIILLFLGHYI